MAYGKILVDEIENSSGGLGHDALTNRDNEDSHPASAISKGEGSLDDVTLLPWVSGDEATSSSQGYVTTNEDGYSRVVYNTLASETNPITLGTEPTTTEGWVVNGDVLTVESVGDLEGLEVQYEGQVVIVKSYHSDTTDGGGIFHGTLSPSYNHNGGYCIDPSRSFPDFYDSTEVSDWFDDSQSTSTAWVRAVVNNTLSIKDFGAKGVYSTDTSFDDSPSIQAALVFCSKTSAGKYLCHAPAGSYLLNSQVVVSATSINYINAYFTGSGATSTFFYVDGSVNSDGGFKFIHSSSRISVELSDFSVYALDSTGLCGVGIWIEGRKGGFGITKNPVVRRVEIRTQNDSVVYDEDTETYPTKDTAAYFSTCMYIYYAGRPVLDNVLAQMPTSSGTTDDSIRFADDSPQYLCDKLFDVSDCYGPSLNMVSGYGGKIGLYVLTYLQSSEGFGVKDSNFTGVQTGIWLDRDDTRTSTEPGFICKGTHINFRDYGVRSEGRHQCRVTDCLFYHPNGSTDVGVSEPTDILVEDGHSFILEGNLHGFNQNRTDRVAVTHAAMTHNVTYHGPIMVTGCQFSAGMGVAVKSLVEGQIPIVDATNYFLDELITYRVRVNGVTYTTPLTKDVFSGAYVPTTSDLVNIDTISTTKLNYSKFGNTARVFGRLSINATTADEFTSFTMALPDVLQGTEPDSGLDAGGVLVSVNSSGVSSYGFVTASGGSLVASFVASSDAVQYVYINVDFLVSQ